MLKKAAESEPKSQLQLWGQEKTAGTRQNKKEAKQGQKTEVLQRQRQHWISQDLLANCTDLL